MTRPDKDQYYLNIAQAVSDRSTCLRAHCGAIIVQNDNIIATGENDNELNHQHEPRKMAARTRNDPA